MTLTGQQVSQWQEQRPRQRVQGEPFYLGSFEGRSNSRQPMGAECLQPDGDVVALLCVEDVIREGQETCVSDLQRSLLSDLTHGTLLRRLSVFKVAAGNRPCASAVSVPTLQQE